MVLVYINPPVTIQCLMSIHIDLCCQTCTDKPLISGHNHGRTHGTPYRSFGYVLLRFGGGGTSLGEWEHNSNYLAV